jgi:hypothetical protein
MNYETCRKNLEALASYYAEHEGQRNEATTRLHLIDRLFFECLGWNRDNCVTEESPGGEYTDYTFFTTKRVLIIEAKKEGSYFELPAGEHRSTYKISSLCRDYPIIKEALTQVSGYCQTRGVPIGCISNGHQVIAFVAARSDGIPPMNGQALVFVSYEAMLADFLTLWNALSMPGITQGYLQLRLLGQQAHPLPPKLSATITGYPGFKGRNTFQTDLKILSDLVLEDIPRGEQVEEDFLKECYCPSGALSQYALISKEILRARYSALFDHHIPGPTLIPAATREGITPELIADAHIGFRGLM